MSSHYGMCAWLLSHVQLFATLWTVACQAPLSMGFSRQEYWSGLPFPPPGDLPDLTLEPMSPASSALQLNFFPTEAMRKPILSLSLNNLCRLSLDLARNKLDCSVKLSENSVSRNWKHRSIEEEVSLAWD